VATRNSWPNCFQLLATESCSTVGEARLGASERQRIGQIRKAQRGVGHCAEKQESNTHLVSMTILHSLHS